MLTTTDRLARPAPVRPPPRPSAGSAPPRRSSLQGGQAAATAALAALTLASATGLLRVFSGHGWMGPVMLTAVAVHATCWAGRRWRLPAGLAVVAPLVVLALVVTWTVFGSTTAFGIPTGATLTHMGDTLRQARVDFSSAIAPVPATTGFTFSAAVGAGVLATIADWIAFRWKTPLGATAPGFALFVVSCTLGQGSGRQWVVALEVAALMAFLLVYQVSARRTGMAWFGQLPGGHSSWTLAAGWVAAAAALLTAVLVTPAVQGVEGRAVLGWRGGLGEGSGPRQVANPVVDLRTRLISETNTPVFTVRSPIPSYWRLTSLSTFTGQTWVSTNSYRSFGARLPGAGAAPPGTRTVTAHFQIQTLDSVWLPNAFNPVSVRGVRGVGYDPQSGSLITAHKTSNGLSYDVTSYQFLATLSPARLEAAPALHSLSSLSQYLELPQSVPASVINLARRLTAGKTTEYDKALALQDYFLGPQFTYTLDPKSDGTGVDTLTNFLFRTREGYCQQFAGAYAVLARAAGLPTRLAVGFATGVPAGDGQYQVTDANAHTWPEVYFGPDFGWLPFEPTKSFSDPSAHTYAGSAPGSSATGSSAADTPSPAPHNGGTAPAGGTHVSTPQPAAGPVPAVVPAATDRPSAGPWPLVFLFLLAAAGWIVLNVGGRRARWWWRRRSATDARASVLARWADVGELLTWWGIARNDGETNAEFANRAAAALRRQLHQPSPWLAGGVVRLAGLADEASFSPALPPGRAEEAGLVAREIHQRLIRGAGARELLRWAVLPQPGRRGDPRPTTGLVALDARPG